MSEQKAKNVISSNIEVRVTVFRCGHIEGPSGVVDIWYIDFLNEWSSFKNESSFFLFPFLTNSSHFNIK